MNDTVNKNTTNSISALVYTSTATRQISEEEIEQLLVKARKHNKELNISGILIYNDGTFMQYLEGSPDKLKELFEIIKLSNLHKDIIEMSFKSIDVRQFSDWSMAYSKDVTKFVAKFIKVG